MKLTCRRRIAGSEWVPDQAGLAAAVGPVVLHRAGGPPPAHARARVPTLVLNTGQLDRTVGVDGALWLAFDVGVALQAGQAGTASRAAPLRALGVDTAGGRATRVDRSWCCSDGSVAAGERVPNVSLVAHTYGHMIPNSAVGIDATQAGARVLALAVDAGLV